MPNTNEAADHHPTMPDERQQHLIDINPSKQKTYLATVGFTVTNCLTHIQQSLDDSEVLGWFIHFKNAETKDNISVLSDLWISKLTLRPFGASKKLDMEKIDNLIIEPKIFYQLPNPGNDFRFADYSTSQVKTEGHYIKQSETETTLLTSDLSHYTIWADAAFLRRSDLNLLRLYLLSDQEGYNDFFFSGAKVNFDIMHDPRLRGMQFGLPDPSSPGDTIPNSSAAFSIKVEPFKNQDVILSLEEINNLLMLEELQEEDQSGSIPGPGDPSDDETSDNKNTIPPFPVAAIAAPCPDYWDVIEEIGQSIGINGPAAAAYLLSLGGGLQSGGISRLSSGFVLPKELIDIVNGPAPKSPPDDFITALYNFLIDIFNSITSFLERGRDARIN